MRVLIVEDEPGVARFLKQAASEAGYSVQLATDGRAALHAATTYDFGLILLDVMLPKLDGFEVCRRLRADGIRTPILMVTARDTPEDKIQGLDSGADDYIVKPFHMGEILARMRALLRRGEAGTGALTVADLTLDPVTREATRGETVVHLSATEYCLLEYLMRNAGRVLTRAMIMEHVWQYDFGGNHNVLNVYISYLRRKIDRGHPVALIHTVRRTGFRMDADETD